MSIYYGKDKLLRADIVLKTAGLVPPIAVSIEGRVVQVKFGPSYRSEIKSNDEFLLFYDQSYAKAYYDEISRLVS